MVSWQVGLTDRNFSPIAAVAARSLRPRVPSDGRSKVRGVAPDLACELWAAMAGLR